MLTHTLHVVFTLFGVSCRDNLIAGVLARNFVLLAEPTLTALRQYLHRPFKSSNFDFYQNQHPVDEELTPQAIEIRVRIRGGHLIQLRALFGRQFISLVQTTVRCLELYLFGRFGHTDFYAIQQGHVLKTNIEPGFPVYVLGRLRGGMSTTKHQTTSPRGDPPTKLRKGTPNQITQPSFLSERPSF